jgi:hypothetical protein
MPQAYPWPDGRAVTEVVRAHRGHSHPNRHPRTPAGLLRGGDQSHRARITNVPADVRKLYAAARPRQAGSPSTRLFKPDSDESVRGCRLLDDQPHPIHLTTGGGRLGLDDFKNAEGFMLGGNP